MRHCPAHRRGRLHEHPKDRPGRSRPRPGRPVLPVRPGPVPEPGLPALPAGGPAGLCRCEPAAHRRGVLRRLRCGDRAVPARGGGDDPGRRGPVRPGHRHGAGVVRLQHRRHPGLPAGPAAVPGRRTKALRRQPREAQPGRGEGRRLLPVRPAPGARLPVLCHQPGHGPDAHPHPHLLLGQPGGDAARNTGVRERRHPAGRGARPGGSAVRRPDPVLHPARHLPPRGQEGAGVDQGPAGAAPGGAAEAVRPGYRGDRRRLRRAGERLHRRGSEGEGVPHREAPHGR